MDGLGGHSAKGNEKDKQKIRRYKPDTSLVKNPPPDNRGNGFDPWSGNKDPTCCGVTKPMSRN